MTKTETAYEARVFDRRRPRPLTGAARVALAAVMAIALAAGQMATSAGSMAAASPNPLLLSQSAAFSILGYWCGGIQEKAFATGFDAASGYPAGNVFLTTTCNGSGRGGHSTTYTAWATATWDLTGALVSDSKLSGPPATDPSLTAYDSHGNEVYNSSNRAYLVLAPGYVPAPRVTSISATIGPAAGGTAVTIDGTGFTGATSVKFGSVMATFTVVSDTEITTTTPTSPAGTFPVTVTTAGGPNTASPSLEFTFIAAPSITSMSPKSGPVGGGTLVTIKGSNFSAVTSVTFDGNWASFTVVDDSTITAASPAGEGPDDASVEATSEGGTSTTTFTYTQAPPPNTPAVAKISPIHGPAGGGTHVTITGVNLLGATHVLFGNAAARRFTVLSASSITAVSPAGHGTVAIRVSTAAGRSPAAAADRFTFKAKPH